MMLGGRWEARDKKKNDVESENCEPTYFQRVSLPQGQGTFCDGDLPWSHVLRDQLIKEG